ncbi:MAG: hypothetical protein U0174_25510 [Polyangiaceae bacterium]
MNRLSVAVLAFGLSLSSCKPKEENYQSVLQLIRRIDVEKNDKGEVEQADFEFEWDPCPGDQIQMVRGGKDFALCMQKYEPGDYVPVSVKHYWNPLGYYTWDVYEIGGCKRNIEESSEGSFEKSQECNDRTMHGKVTGFDCSRRPFRKLLAVCPWMARQ